MGLTLHVGLSKTGTTSIQLFLWRNRNILLKKFGILYPKTGIKEKLGYGQHLIPNILRSKQNYSDLKNMLIREINNHKADNIVISSEEFIFSCPKKVYKFFDFIHTEKIVIYLRRQDLWIESLYKEYVKNIHSRGTMSFKDFLKGAPHIKICFFSNFVERWKEVFPNTEIILKFYDRKLFQYENIIFDFLPLIGLSHSKMSFHFHKLETKLETNRSLSTISTLVLRMINENLNLNDSDHKKVVQLLFEMDNKYASHKKTSLFSLSDRIEFLNTFEKSNKIVSNLFFNNNDIFRLTDEEMEIYKRQIYPSETEIKERYIEILRSLEKKIK